MNVNVTTGQIRKNRFEPINIEAGIGPGIPTINLYGDTNAKLHRLREKFRFLFRSIGRKLPNKKIHICITCDSGRLNDRVDLLELPIALAIYLITNPIESDKQLYATGRISMSGELTGNEIYYNLMNYALNLSKSGILFHPRSKKHIHKVILSRSVSSNQHNSLLELIRTFEGIENPNLIQMKSENLSLPIESIIYILKSLNRDCLILNYDKNLFKKVYISPTVETLAYSELIEPNQENIYPFIRIQNESQIHALNGLCLAEKQYILLEDIHLYIKHFFKLIDERRWKIIASIPQCPCRMDNCICSTFELQKHNSIIYSAIKANILVFDLNKVPHEMFENCLKNNRRETIINEKGSEVFLSHIIKQDAELKEIVS